MTASAWTCQFLSQHRNSRPDASGEGQASQVLSSSTTAVVETDDMHTFRVLCPIPADMAACLGASLCAGQGGPRRVFGGFFRDGKPVGGLIDQVDAESGGADQVHMLGLSELVFTGGAPNPAGRDGWQGRRVPVEICTMVRDEADHIEEFVAYHLLFGLLPFLLPFNIQVLCVHCVTRCNCVCAHRSVASARVSASVAGCHSTQVGGVRAAGASDVASVGLRLVAHVHALSVSRPQ